MAKPRARLTKRTIASHYSSGRRIEPTAANFPALKNFWDMNHLSDDRIVLYDTVGTQYITSTSLFQRTAKGFSKASIGSNQWPPARYEAPGDRDFMLIGVGNITYETRAITVGGNYLPFDPDAPGMAWELSYPTQVTPSAFLSPGNYTQGAQFAFAGDERLSHFATTPESVGVGIVGCYATVISPTAGTCKGYWAGRTADDYAYEEIQYGITGSIQATWSELGRGWTMYPGNFMEWAGLMMFESGAPLDMQLAMEWMAQYNDIRIYPGWLGKK